jgi:hypothetical protein
MRRIVELRAVRLSVSAPRLAEAGPRATALAGANVPKAQKVLSLPRGWALSFPQLLCLEPRSQVPT